MMNQIVRRIFAGVSAVILSVSAIGSDTLIGNFRQTLHADSDEPVLKQGSTTGFDSLEQDTRTDDSDNKIYNTNYGLHTDKTVSKAYSDGRTFDIDLESWYIGERPADVGMVLDASGSMAWTTTNPDPIYAGDIDELEPNTFLTDEQLKLILDPEKTDNSKISYTDYQYYIYEARPSVSEFVPLGYWDGSLITNTFDPIQKLKETWKDKSLVAFYPFAKRDSGSSLQNQINTDSSQNIKPIDKSSDSDMYTTDNYTGSESFGTSGSNSFVTEDNNAAWDSTKPGYSGSFGGFMLGTAPTIGTDESYNFTISFSIHSKKSKPTSKENTYLFVGPLGTDLSDKNYCLFNSAKTANRFGFHTVSSTVDKSVTDGNTQGEISKSSKKFVTVVCSSEGDGKVSLYFNGVHKNTEFFKLSTENLGIIFCPSLKDNIYLDDIYLFDTALNADDVKTLYENAQKQTVQVTTESIKDRAVDDKGNVLAQLPDALQKATVPLNGWYYVNSAQDWEPLIDSNIGTGKQFQGLKTDKEKNATDYYTALNFATVPLTADDKLKDLIKSGNNISGGIKLDTEENGASPVKFFIDNAGYLRCFFNSGGDSTADNITKFNGILESPYDEDGKLKPYTTEVRTQCSLVYKKQDVADIKTQTLNKVLNYFIDGVQDSSSESKISAMRFSNNNMVLNKEKNGIRDDYKDNLKKLLLLDWTSKGDAEKNVYSENLADSRETLGLGDNTNFSINVEGSELYNYFLTGGTNTWVGLKAFADNMTESVKDDKHNKYLILFTDGRDTLESGTDVDKVNKIVGEVKPTSSTITESTDLAKAWADELKNQGYTIFCVMMASGSISKDMPATTEGEETEYEKAVDFLKTIASENPESTGEEKEYYVYTADSAENLQNAFTSILNQIKKPLTNYTIQDYIDPRFDLVDKDGNILKLGAGGNITDSVGTHIETVTDETYLEYTPKELSYKGGEYDKAKIYYDSEKDMYYLRWKVDSIGGGNTPFNTEGTETYLKESQADNPETTDENEEQAGRWYSTITVKAKEDFIGGNAILTNGNEAGMNLVFASKELYDEGGNPLTGKDLRDKLSSLSGTDKSQDRNYDGTETSVTSPSKGFPRVCVNVRLLPIQTKPLNEVIYLGEVVSPTIMLNEIESDYMSGSYYLEYLERYAYRLYGDSMELSKEERPLIQLLNEWLGVDKPEKIVKTFTIPYIYLPSVKYTAEGKIESRDKQNNVGTPERNQKDIVGFITYTWKRECGDEPQQKIEGLDSEGNPQYNITLEYVVKDTQQIKYDLELKFTPLPENGELKDFELDKNFIPDDTFFKAEGGEFKGITDTSKEWTFGTRVDSLAALVNEEHTVDDVKKPVYEWDSGYKPTAGTPQVEEEQNYGDATISKDKHSLIASTTYTKDVVNAGLALEMIVQGKDLNGSTTVKNNGTFTFEATRNYDDELDPIYYKSKDDDHYELDADTPDDGEKYELTFEITGDIPKPSGSDDENYYTIWAKLTTITKKGETLEKDETLENGLPIGTYTITKDLEDTEKITIKDEKYFKNLNADSNRGNFIHTYFPDDVCKESSYAATDTGDEKYLIWDETKNLDFAKENIAENTKDTTTNSLTFYFGTKLNGITKGESVKDKPETTDDYAKDRLGIIMLSYGSNRLAISKEVTSKNIAVIKEDAVLNNFWKFDITLTLKDDVTSMDTTSYSLKCLYLDTGKEVEKEDMPKVENNPVTKLAFTKNSENPKEYTATIYVKSNTQVILEQLPDEVEKYEVSEVRAKQEEKGDFRDRYRYDIIVDNKIADDQSKGTSSGKLSPASSVNFINQFPSPELPSAGGAGIDITLYCGIMLVVAAGLYFTTLFCKKCRTHDEREE